VNTLHNGDDDDERQVTSNFKTVAATYFDI
jgi:hypothetical protein